MCKYCIVTTDWTSRIYVHTGQCYYYYISWQLSAIGVHRQPWKSCWPNDDTRINRPLVFSAKICSTFFNLYKSIYGKCLRSVLVIICEFCMWPNGYFTTAAVVVTRRRHPHRPPSSSAVVRQYVKYPHIRILPFRMARSLLVLVLVLVDVGLTKQML